MISSTKFSYFLELKAFPYEYDRQKDIVRVTTHYKAPTSGTQSYFDPNMAAVSITVKVADIPNMTDVQKNRLRLIAAAAQVPSNPAFGADAETLHGRYHISSDQLQFTVNDFPFREQNLRRAKEILKDLITAAKNDKMAEEIELDSLTLKMNDELSEKVRRQKALEYPMSWLKSAASNKSTSQLFAKVKRLKQ